MTGKMEVGGRVFFDRILLGSPSGLLCCDIPP